jgi:RNA polymerase sigma-70 factor (ECF subfamily)
VDASAATDAELIERVATRDVDAFAQLHRRYVRAALGLALRTLDEREEAERGAGAITAAFWTSASSFDRSQHDPTRWAFDVARSRMVGSSPDAVDHASAWASWRAHRALATLPEPERHVIELAYWGGQAPGDISSFLHTTPEAVESLARSALSRIADELGASEGS